MKKTRKIVALMLSLALVFSTFTVSFAAEEKTDAEICEALNLIQGDGDGVTDEYLSSESPRWKIAIMSLRLRGKYDEALAYEGTETFSDAKEMSWVGGRAILAYLKANPQYGWLGRGEKFDPNGMMSVQEYYKVMLETLGYKQGIDFEWSEVMAFAKGKGLVAAAYADKLTMANVAAVTVETLKADNKQGTKLVNVLVEDGSIPEELAGMVGYEAPVTAVMIDAKAIDTTTIRATFSETVDFNTDDFMLRNGNVEYSIEGVSSADNGKTAILTVNKLLVGNKYTLTNSGESITVVPTTENDKSAPEIAKATAITGTIVKVTIGTRNVNQDTIVPENFTLNSGADVLTATIDEEAMKEEGNEYKTIVILEVSGLKSHRAYTISSRNIESYEGAVATDSKAVFAGKDLDKSAPKVASARSEAGYQVVVTFDEAVLLDEATATDINNYSISPELDILSAKIKKNVIGDEKGNNVVILTTSYQKAHTAYTLTANHISDGTNVMRESSRAVFAGIKKPDYQVATMAKAINGNKVEVRFEYEANDTALDISNYSINRDIEISDAKFKEDRDSSENINRKIVLLTTSNMKSSTAYEVTVGTGVQDVLGQGLRDSKRLVYAGQDVDKSFTTYNVVEAIDENTIRVAFGEEVDSASARRLDNYYISELKYPSEISLDKEGRVATLKVATQSPSKSYILTMNNIKDLAGNVIKSDTKISFTGIGKTQSDIRVISADAISRNRVKVKFNQTIKSGTVYAKVTYEGGSSIKDMPSVLTGSISSNSDTVVIPLPINISSNNVYRVTVTDVPKGYYTNHILNSSENSAMFVGSDTKEAVFSILPDNTAITALDKTHIRVNFDSPLDITPSNVKSGVLKLYTDIDLDDEYKVDNVQVMNLSGTKLANNNKSLIFTLNKPMADNQVYYVKLYRTYDDKGTSNTSDDEQFKTPEGLLLEVDNDRTYNGKAYVVTSNMHAAEDTKLEVESAVMFNENTLQVKFNTDVVVSSDAIAQVAATNDPLKLDPNDIIIVNDYDDSHKVEGTAVTKIVPVDSRTLTVYITGADKLNHNENMMYYLKFLSHSSSIPRYTNFKTLVGEQHFGSNKNYGYFPKSTTDNEFPKIILAQAVTENKIKVTVSEKVFKNVQEHNLNADNFIIKDLQTNQIISDSDDLECEVIDFGSNKYREFYIAAKKAVFLSGKKYRIGFIGDVVDESGVRAKVYDTSSTDNDKSRQFGGIVSSMTAPSSDQLSQWLLDVANMKVVLTDTEAAKINSTVYKLEAYFGTGTPFAEYYRVLASDEVDKSNIAIPLTANSSATINNGDKVYYRFTDQLGKSSGWVQDGTVVLVNAPGLTGVTVADDDTSNDKTSITMPAVPSGATKFLYVISSDTNAVPTPNVGADWSANVGNALTASTATNIVVANGKHIGIAAVDTNNKVVQFVDKVAITEVEVAAPGLTGVTVADDDTSNDKTSITMPAVPSGATKFLYVISSDTNAVPTPNVGADWSANVGNALTASTATNIVVANGKHIGIAAVDTNNKVVQFVDKVAITEVEVAAPGLMGVTVADDDTSNDKTSITMPAVPSGATKFLYVISSDTNAVPTPNVGTDWSANVGNILTASTINNIVVANGKHIGVAAVDTNNKVVQFVDVVAITEVE